MLVAVAVVATAALADCSGASSNTGPGTATIATIGRRYQAAVDPANLALAGMLKQALAYGGGSSAQLNSAVPATVASLKSAARRLQGIGAPTPLRRDIVDVMNSLNTVVDDLNTMKGATGEIQGVVARFVADAGRESAADTLVRLAISQLSSPTSLPAELLVPSTTIAQATTSTTASRRTTTTRPKTSTTANRLPTTIFHTTTTKRLTTTTKAATP